ncbi:MAG: hypothetical protein IKX19_03590 [Clostridia bacterium]|nr:hypothetical protein [Clostridia bacterium]
MRSSKGQSCFHPAVFLLAVLLLLTSCRRKQETAQEPDIEKTNSTQNIFNEAAFPLPDGAELYTTVTPHWDAETGELTYLAKRTPETETKDGSWSVLEIPVLVTADLRAGEVKSETELPGSADEGPAEGAIYADEAVLVLATPDRHYRLMRYDRKKKKAEISETINSLFPRQVLGIAGAVRDADGNAAVLSQDELLFVDRKWKVVRSAPLPPDTQAEGLMTLPDSTILAKCTDRSGATGYAFYDAENARFEDFTSDERTPVPCGSGFNYCYGLYINDGTGGIFGVDPNEEEPIYLLNYINSGIQGASLWFAADRDTMIFTVTDTDYLNATFSVRPMLYLRGEDRDLSGTRVLHLAYANTQLSPGVTKAISDFNLTHTDVQIEINDYTEVADGANRLALDMVTGVFQPDILLGYELSPYLLTAAEKGLYADLSPFLDADPLVTRDNLFDAVERFFDDGNGGLWGLSTNFTVYTTISTLENLGLYAEKGFWTIFDILDYIEGLPEGVDFSEKFTQSTMTALLSKPGSFLEFVDGDVCSFDSPAFNRCLDFLSALPNETEYAKTSPYANMEKLDLTEAYLSGRIMTAAGSITSLTDFSRFHLLFGTKDWFPIGGPVSEERRGAGNSVGIGLSTIFLITSSCEMPEFAWELCRAFFTDEEYQGGLPSLRTMLDSMAEPYIGREYLWWYERGGKWSRGEGTITDEDRQSPHVSGIFTEEDYAKLIGTLDEAGVSAFRTKKYTEVGKIIQEEISAFLGGVGSAEDCAKKIQSRASIWLAEHQ